MRFDRLTIRAFGQFTDYAIPFDSAKNFHLLFGLNEAGKSTALRAITDFLYGIPARTTDSFLHDNGSLRIEGQLRKSTGETLQFVRRKGMKHTVLDLDGHPISEALVNQYLNGLTKEHFLNMFALDHVRMREGGEGLLQSGGNLGESLFSAASGLTRLRKVLDRLENQSRDIFKKSGKKTPLNKLISEEKELKKAIAERQLKVRNWNALEKSYRDGEEKIEEIKRRLRALRRRKTMLERIKLTLPKLAKLRDLEEKLAALADVPDLPDDAGDRRRAAQNALSNAVRDGQRADEEHKELLRQLSEVRIPDGLFEQTSRIETLFQELAEYQKNRKRIPLLEGKRDQLDAQLTSAMKELDPARADIRQIGRFRLSAEKKETIRQLCKQKPLLDHTRTALQNDLERIGEEQQKKQDQLNALPDQPGSEEIERAVEKARRAGDIESLLSSLEKKLALKQAQIDEAVKRLPLWHGTVWELIGRSFAVLTETVRLNEQKKRALDQSRQKIIDQIHAQEEIAATCRKQIRELDSLAEIPSEAQLTNVRKHRDQGWGLIRNKLERGDWGVSIDAYTGSRAIEDVYEDDVRESDRVADRMRAEAAKVGEKNKYLADSESSRHKIVQLKAEQEQLNRVADQWQDDWNALWATYGITPLSPAEMDEWLVKYEQIRTMVQDSDDCRRELDALNNKKSDLHHLLHDVLKNRVTVSEKDGLEDLISLAEDLIRKTRTALTKRDNLKASLADGRKHEEELTGKLKENSLKRQQWAAAWQDAVAGTSITPSTVPAIAETLLNRYEQLALREDERQRVIIDLEKVRAQVQDFMKKTREMTHLFSIGMDETDCGAAVNRLYQELQKARTDQETLRGLHQRLKRIGVDAKSADQKRKEAEALLTGLIRQAGCTTAGELEKTEQASLFKKQRQSELSQTRKELLQIGDGLSLDELAREAAQIDRNSLAADLDEIGNELEQLEPERSQCEQDHGAVKHEYEEKIQGNSTDAVRAEQEKEGVLAQIAYQTDQYIQLKMASLLLQKGIEQYRNQNQDPILKRAGELFTRLTLRSFTGLTVDYDEKDQPVLMGTHASGGKVPLEGMSDGTKDQLYLSLRLASIEKYAAHNEPIPFIVDDILIHFDDLRAKETLRVLLGLSKRTQVIFFTHHERLVAMMHELASNDEYQLFELNPERASVAK
ncbi:YhaN family protein [Sporolactobacillus vineae]|uniref:YhaN family protein n=1 Tax=Sporolactobacillus vineae TaxID=444463 RepID=UPI00028824D5|nr:YhaN family protein [Sporolactobacillus vineae]